MYLTETYVPQNLVYRHSRKRHRFSQSIPHHSGYSVPIFCSTLTGQSLTLNKRLSDLVTFSSDSIF